MSGSFNIPGLDLTDPDSVRIHIFNYTYLYAIPGYYRYSKEYNEKVGHLSTGSKRGDANALSEYVNIGGTIKDILVLFEKGADILMTNREDIVSIYEVLISHLGFWRRNVEQDPNIRNAPLDSLYLMSDYCDAIRDQVIGFKPNVLDIPHFRRVASIFGSGEGISELFNQTGVGVGVEESEPILDRIEKLLSERKQSTRR